MTDSNPEPLTPQEAAALLRVNERTVRNMVNRNELASYRIGRHIRILRSTVDAYMGAAR